MSAVTENAPSIPVRAPAPSNSGASAVDCLTYNNIRTCGLCDLGQFRTIKEKFGWRVRRPVNGVDPASRPTTQLDGADVKLAVWMCIGGREHGMKVVMKNDDIHRFDGFKPTDYEPLQKHIKQHWGVDLQKSRMASRGWHWGVGKIGARSFTFEVDHRDAFEIPKERVCQVSVNKGDVAIVLDNDERRCDAEDQLLELRLYIPPSKTGLDDNWDSLRDKFMLLPGSKSVPLLQTICSFSDLKVLVPAGRFDVQITRKTMKLQGKSSDFTIDYRAVTEMYLLHTPPSPHVHLVLRLASPLRKGHTPYFNVVIQFDDKKTVDMELGLSQEDINALQSSSSNVQVKLDSHMEGAEYDVATQVLKALVGKPLITSENFKSAIGQPFFRSSYKADSGNFYPLENGFVFIPKPVIIIKYEEVASVSFGRTSGAQTKLFEFDVAVKAGQTFSFSSVDRQESGPFIEFLQGKGISVRSFRPDDKVEAGSGAFLDQELLSEDDSDDEDFEEDEDDEEDEDEDYNEDEDVTSEESDHAEHDTKTSKAAKKRTATFDKEHTRDSIKKKKN